MDVTQHKKVWFQQWLFVVTLAIGFCIVGVGLCLLIMRARFPRIVVCDVGQGDAVLVRSGTTTILIDTGPDGSLVSSCLRRYLPWFDRSIDLLVLSHQHDDHIGGVREVLQQFPVRQVVWNGLVEDTQVSRDLEQNLKKRAGVITPSQGTTWRWPGGQLTVVWPPPGWKSTDQNQSSLGVSIRLESFGFLSLGDLECAQELAVGGGILLKHWQVAKISHHGSKTASCPQFFARNRPEVAFMSLGKGNKYGHPDRGTMQTLSQLGVTVLRTDQMGSLELRLRPEGIQWSPENATELQKAVP